MTALLQAVRLSKRFGGVQAVADVSFELSAAELLAIIGPNGAGKTTLLNLVTGLESADAGSVLLDGREIGGATPWANAGSGMARTLQKAVVFPAMTVTENVMIGHGARRRVSFTEALFGLPGVRRWEQEAREKTADILRLIGLEAYAERPASELALGLQRLVEIARALATEPRVLLLDEPAAGLAREEVDRLASVLRAVSERGLGVCLVEHNMRLVMGIARRVLVLHQGARLFEGTPAEIQLHPEVIAAYLGSRAARRGIDAAS